MKKIMFIFFAMFFAVNSFAQWGEIDIPLTIDTTYPWNSPFTAITMQIDQNNIYLFGQKQLFFTSEAVQRRISGVWSGQYNYYRINKVVFDQGSEYRMGSGNYSVLYKNGSAIYGPYGLGVRLTDSYFVHDNKIIVLVMDALTNSKFGLAVSINSGETFDTTYVGQLDNLKDLYWYGGTAYILGEDYVFKSATSNLLNWEKISLPNINDCINLSATSEYIFTCGANQLFRNGQLVLTTMQSNIVGMDFNGTVGYILSADGLVRKTTNNGDSWATIVFMGPVAGSLDGFFNSGKRVFCSNNYCYILFGNERKIYTYDITGVKEEGEVINNYKLHQNYPNPFNPVTKIKYQLPKDENVSLKVFDMTGKEVVTLVNKKQSAGNYEVSFNGSTLSSGVYFYKLQAGNYIETKKMMLIK